MDAIAHAGVPLGLLARDGRFRARLLPDQNDPRATLGQWATLQHPQRRLQHARLAVLRKLKAARAVLAHARRTGDSFAPTLQRIDESQSKLYAAATLDQVRGLEGIAARAYWASFPSLIRTALPMKGRNRRPPTDPVNAMLSLGYSLLTREAAAVLQTLGLEPALGHLHSPRGRGPALALDLIEPFRHQFIDRMVLREINLRRFTDADFQTRAGGVQLTPQALRRFLHAYEETFMQPRRGLTSRCQCLRELLLHRCDILAARCRRAGQRVLDRIEQP